MEDDIFKRRAILVDFDLLVDKRGVPNYFLLKLCDNQEINGYSDLIILAEDPEKAKQWIYQYCLGEQTLVYKTEKHLIDDVQTIKRTHKTIGAIVSRNFNTNGVNTRLIQIMRIMGK